MNAAPISNAARSELVQILLKLAEYNDLLDEQYRASAYRRAANNLSKMPINLLKLPLPKIPGVGTSIAAKINEYFRSGHVAELEHLRKDRTVAAITELSSIRGVGIETSKKWIAQGIINVAAVKTAVARGVIKLTKSQRYGILYQTDLQTRIPRPEVTEIAAKMLALIKHTGTLLQTATMAEVAGSYRRGAASSADIDIIVTSSPYRAAFVSKYLDMAIKMDGYVDVLARGITGVTILYKNPSSGLVRQVDIMYVEGPSYWPGILHFTGSAGFNQYLRGRAKAAGYKLNQYGIFRGTARIHVSSEQDIFDRLQMQFIPPRERNK